MKKNVAFTIPNYTNDLDTFPIPLNENYDYWVQMAKYFLAKSNTIEIHCWNDENETIEELIGFSKQSPDIKNEDNLTIFTWRNTTALSEYLLENFSDKNGRFKWFTVNLDQDDAHIFHSGHWGTEFSVPNVSEKEIDFIEQVTPENTSFIPY